MRKGRILFCDNWKFALTEPDSTKEELKDVHWYNVEVPHDWLIGDPRNLYKSGTGWYRKSFNVEETELSDSFILCFDGVYMDTTVYINGKEAGEWKYGYTSFSFDISQYLVSGENEVLVRVNHKAPNTRWYSGAGIYRNVYLRHTNSRYIAEDGVYISTKCNYHINNKNPGRWRVCIETEFNAELDGVVAHRITDPDGKEVYFAERRVCGCSDKAVFFTDTPVLWDIYEPNLYTVTTTLLTEKGEVLDEVQNDFGYRTTEFSNEKGFSLNCMGLKLRGVCMHHDLGALGAAVNFDATLRQLLTLKAMGVNAVRTSHNPPSREFMDICDRIGLLVVSEFVDMWEMPKSENDYSRFFPQWYKTDVRAWVRRDRNHPSLIMWSIGNEIQDTHESERGLEIAKALYAEVQKHDPYKNAETTIASNYMPWENAQKVADHVKIAGYNYAERLYNEHHKAHPDWVIFGSETASTVRSRGIYRFPAEVQQLTHDDMQCSDLLNSVVEWGANPVTSYLMDRDADLSMGQFVWTGFDYIGEPTPYSTKSSYFGIVDTAGIPKDSYYLYKALWDKGAEPFIHLLPHWDYNEGQTVDVFAYSNLPVLELTYGQTTYKKQIIDVNKSDKLYAHWKLPYSKDLSPIVKGYESEDAALPVCQKILRKNTDAVRLCVNADRFEARADGRSMFFLHITALDRENGTVPNANNRVKISIKGPARIVGMDNGDSTDYDSYKSDNRRLFSGGLTVMLMTLLEPGAVYVTAESEGLSAATIKLHATPCDLPEGVSVAEENPFPVVMTEYTREVPIRKIELIDGSDRILDVTNDVSTVEVKIYPENATYSDIAFKCCNDNGVEIDYAEVTEFDGEKATVRAKGNGNFRLRAYTCNGKPHPDIISELEYLIRGFDKPGDNNS